MKTNISLETAIIRFAGFMVLLSVALTYWLHPNFMWFTVFIGANLFQSSFTGFCPAATVLQKFGFQSSSNCSDK
ncbi:DUF2892 domain-containing protein [Thalassotalea sp. SU-HH00458]